MAYECDICGKEFTNTFGAFFSIRKPPYYDQMVYCKTCNEYVRQQKAKTYNPNRKEVKRHVGYSA